MHERVGERAPADEVVGPGGVAAVVGAARDLLAGRSAPPSGRERRVSGSSSRAGCLVPRWDRQEFVVVVDSPGADGLQVRLDESLRPDGLAVVDGAVKDASASSVVPIGFDPVQGVANEVGVFEACPREISVPEIRSTEVRASEVRSSEAGRLQGAHIGVAQQPLHPRPDRRWRPDSGWCRCVATRGRGATPSRCRPASHGGPLAWPPRHTSRPAPAPCNRPAGGGRWCKTAASAPGPTQ
jgi:hypothetical protein